MRSAAGAKYREQEFEDDARSYIANHHSLRSIKNKEYCANHTLFTS